MNVGTVSEHMGPLRFPVIYLTRSNPHLLQIRATMVVETVMFAYACTVPLAAFGLQCWFRSFKESTHGVS